MDSIKGGRNNIAQDSGIEIETENVRACVSINVNRNILISIFCRFFAAKSWGVPVKLTCDDRSTRRIDISGISLFKVKHTFDADDFFPGIEAQSERECQLSFHLANETVPAECELRFQGKVLPFDVMVVAVYRCFAPAQLPNETIHTSKAYFTLV